MLMVLAALTGLSDTAGGYRRLAGISLDKLTAMENTLTTALSHIRTLKNELIQKSGGRFRSNSSARAAPKAVGASDTQTTLSFAAQTKESSVTPIVVDHLQSTPFCLWVTHLGSCAPSTPAINIFVSSNMVFRFKVSSDAISNKIEHHSEHMQTDDTMKEEKLSTSPALVLGSRLRGLYWMSASIDNRYAEPREIELFPSDVCPSSPAIEQRKKRSKPDDSPPMEDITSSPLNET
ncbi:hypothetical protein PROFUN_04006 [Planoprotostelium fungivorum]|uniref:Uncharacterized protein n=1 Tax=Planoprotostelium fungivorum TaxID=1890364 RepID=A0A2P6NW42_9EUKA|nr:hypothetical protein PROFUN_04006 [Planoprotostelium fungivorum]